MWKNNLDPSNSLQATQGHVSRSLIAPSTLQVNQQYSFQVFTIEQTVNSQFISQSNAIIDDGTNNIQKVDGTIQNQEYLITTRISMSEQIYKPKHCAFHPKEMIFNFCKNSDCLLPLCPTCVKVHTEEHRSQNTYGQFQNINKVVGDLSGFFEKMVKELNNHTLDMKEHQQSKVKDQENLKKRIGQAKAKMMTVVERFFTDFEKEVSKSIVCFNQSMKENYTKVDEHVEQLKREIEEKNANLTGDKVLKTLIGFHAREEEAKYSEQLQCIKERIEYLDTQKVEVVCSPPATQKVIEELGNYIYLAFQNWENEIKYVADFVKTGQLMSTGDGFFKKSV